jgi:hypothetical protein
MRTRWISYTAAATILASTLTTLVGGPATAGGTTYEYLEGVERFSASTGSDAQQRKTASVSCPGTKVVVGAGWTTSPASGELLVEDLIPTETGVTAVVREDADGYAYDWRLTVHAVCAEPPPSYTIESEPGSVTFYGSSDTRVDCPVGLVVLGLGFSISDTTGVAVLDAADPNQVSVNITVYEHYLSAVYWSADAYAICAELPIGWHLLTSSNQTAYPSTAEYTACDADEAATGAGAYLDAAEGQVSVTSLRTITYLDDDHGVATAHEDGNGTPDDWDLTTETICVDIPPS